MELSWEKLEHYQKSLRPLQEAADVLLSHMKGHDWSFRQSITDKKGEYSPEKLRALVEDLLSLWAAKVRAGTDTDPDTGESVAEPYLRDRRELYGLYFYLVMRCSLEKGGVQPRPRRRGDEGADGLRLSAGAGKAALPGLVRHGRAGRNLPQRAVLWL